MASQNRLALVPPGAAKRKSAAQRCGLCGKAKQLTKTDCCGNWVCYDAADLYARNSCLGRHSRYTLCNFHHNEGHDGPWKDCKKCRKAFKTEIYVWYGTNEHNFEKLEHPPSFEPTLCATCGKRINLGTDGYSQFGDDHWCEECSNRKMEQDRLPTSRSSLTRSASRRHKPRSTRVPRRRD